MGSGARAAAMLVGGLLAVAAVVGVQWLLLVTLALDVKDWAFIVSSVFFFGFFALFLAEVAGARAVFGTLRGWAFLAAAVAAHVAFWRAVLPRFDYERFVLMTGGVGHGGNPVVVFLPEALLLGGAALLALPRRDR